MKLLKFEKARISRRKSHGLVENSIRVSCIFDLKALNEAQLIAEEFKRLGGGNVNVNELAEQISSDYQASFWGS